MKVDLNEALTYDDVVIVPQFSEHTSRAQSDTSWSIKNYKFTKPIIAANMDTICGPDMALQMAQLGGLGIIHRYLTVAQYKEISDSWHANNPEFPLAFAVGTLSNDKERIDFCMNGGCEIICIDIAHGDCQAMLDTIAYIRASWNGALIAGNTATFEGTKRLIDAGADMVKVGVGAGCFNGSTPVLMADRTTKAIKDVQEGDYVLNRYNQPVRVLASFSQGFKKVFEYKVRTNATSTIATPDHLHMVWQNDRYAWTPLNEVGDKRLQTLDSLDSTIEYIRELPLEQETYDIEVDCPTHSFIANNVIVHNSVCSTRVKAGAGMSQLTAAIECAEAGPIIADGGIKEPSHACKALAAGATAVMLGGMLAGTDKAPGWINPLDFPNAETKISGMASLFSKTKAGLRGINAEGVERTVSCKPAGSTAHVVEDITEGIRSAMSYTGAFTLEEFTKKAVLRKISIAGQAEGPPHFKDK